MLTQACLRALRQMILAEISGKMFGREIVSESGSWWLGDKQISVVTVSRLLRVMAVTDKSRGDFTARLVPSQIGRLLVSRPESLPEISSAVLSKSPFTIEGGRVVILDPDDHDAMNRSPASEQKMNEVALLSAWG